jgi:hypothetical protein
MSTKSALQKLLKGLFYVEEKGKQSQAKEGSKE